MRRSLFILFTVLTSLSFLDASIHVKPYLGYGFGLGKHRLPLSIPGIISMSGQDIEVNSANLTTKRENLYASGANGFNLGVQFLYDLDQTTAVGLGLGYITGSEITINKLNDQSVSPAAASEQKAKASMMPLDLFVKFSGTIASIRPYAGFGITYPLSAAGSTSFVYTAGSSKSELEADVTFNPSLGWNACLGADYDLSPTMYVSAGLFLRQLTLTLKHLKMTKYTVNGQDQLGTLTISQQEVDYVENDPDQAQQEPGYPSKENTTPVSFSSLTIQAGVGFKF
ncbi:MAG: hypothetical protein PHF84_05265 [bacterium]|nr:hypothetical protein [bacterium]